MCIPPNQWPKRCSMTARVARANGWPGERSTSCTRGGTAASPAIPLPRMGEAYRWSVIDFVRHSSHSLSMPSDPPQTHLRCTRLVCAEVDDDVVADTLLTCVC